jgi:hypothetical protein
MLIAALANAYARKSKANPLSLQSAKAQTSTAPLTQWSKERHLSGA